MKRKYASSYRALPRRTRRRTGSFVSAAVGVASHAYRAYTKTRSRKKSDFHVAHSGPSCTSRVTYTKKRMPLRRRKAWRKFTKKVQAVDLVGLPKSTFRTRVLRRWTSGMGSQYMDGIAFRPGDAQGDAFGCDDVMSLNQYATDSMGLNVDTTKQPVDRAAADYQSNGPRISSYVLDLQMTNVLASNAYVEMYEVVARHDIKMDASYPNERKLLQTCFDNHAALAGTLSGGDDSPQSSTANLKLFDIKEFTSLFKISKVETITLPPNGSCTRQWRDPGNTRVGMSLYQNLLFRKGDKALFFTCYGPVGLNSSTQVYCTPTDIVVQATRSYKWCMQGYHFSTFKTRTVGPPLANALT